MTNKNSDLETSKPSHHKSLSLSKVMNSTSTALSIESPIKLLGLVSPTWINIGRHDSLEEEPKNEEMLLYDGVFEQTGGLGNYQILLLILNTIVVNYGGTLAYNFGYMTAR